MVRLWLVINNQNLNHKIELAMADIVFLALLVIHVGSIISWFGGAALFVSVISPSLRTMSAPARGEFVTATLPRYFRFIEGTSIMAVVAGISLYGYIIASNQAPSGAGQIALQSGALVALVALILLFGVGVPAGKKMVSLVKQMGKVPSEDLAGKLAVQQRKATMAARVGVALLGITLVLMILGAEL
jgi:uncharacterized membrane protein